MKQFCCVVCSTKIILGGGREMGVTEAVVVVGGLVVRVSRKNIKSKNSFRYIEC